jgi:hypothetical protein
MPLFLEGLTLFMFLPRIKAAKYSVMEIDYLFRIMMALSGQQPDKENSSNKVFRPFSIRSLKPLDL